MAKPMTDLQALAEAVRRWGKDSRAWHPSCEVRGGLSWCCLGVSNGRTYIHQWALYGVGRNWEEAFADADARGN